jgi:carboxyl-terminal processing protease
VRLACVLATSLLWTAVACGGSSAGSIGAVLGRDNDSHALFVRDVPAGLAANKAGLLPGDEIVMIEGFYVRDLSMKEIRALLRGDVGSKLEVTIVRGEQVQRVKLTRTALREPKPVTEKKEEKVEE